MPPIVSRLANADISTLTAIKAAAFGPDALQNTMFPPDRTTSSYGPWAEQVYRGPLQTDPTCRLLKCTDSSTGEMMAVALWHFYDTADSFDSNQGHDTATLNPPEGSNPALWHAFNAAMKGSRTKHMAGKPFYLLKLLVTHPNHQRKGAGTALVTYGISAADKAGVPCYLEASPFGYQLYKKYGFVKVDELTIDLNPYGVNDAWRGVVMIRQPGGQ